MYKILLRACNERKKIFYIYIYILHFNLVNETIFAFEELNDSIFVHLLTEILFVSRNIKLNLQFFFFLSIIFLKFSHLSNLSFPMNKPNKRPFRKQPIWRCTLRDRPTIFAHILFCNSTYWILTAL